jgi:ABC-2 type transport system ATP-binding protein
LFDGVIDHFGLDPRAKAGHLSRGERAGLCLALTLAPEPELLVLDDPALGLDPVARRALVEAMLVVTSRRDRTILLSSHYLDDVERVADHLAILDRGILRVHCPIDEFRQRLARWVLRFSEPLPEVPKIEGLVHSRIVENELHLTIANPNEETEAALSQTGAVAIDRVSLSLDQAMIDYLSDRGRSSTLLQAVTADSDVPHSDAQPSAASFNEA